MPCPGRGKSPSTIARVTVVEIPTPGRSRWKARKSETWQPWRSSIWTYSPAESSYAFASAGPTRASARGTRLAETATALRVQALVRERRAGEHDHVEGNRFLSSPQGADRRVDGSIRLLGADGRHGYAGGVPRRPRDGRAHGLHDAAQGRHRRRRRAGIRQHDRHA